MLSTKMTIKYLYFSLVLLILTSALTWQGLLAPASGNIMVQAYGGANHTGPYDPYNVGAPSGNGSENGNHNGRPAAGTVGNADTKNPQGQCPDGTDRNAGYECDRNHGIGQTNPAHTGCKITPTPRLTATPSPTPTAKPTNTPTPTPTTPTPTASPTSTPTPTPTNTPGNNNNNGNNSQSNNNGSNNQSSQGSVLGVSTLASTGAFLSRFGQGLQIGGSVIALTGAALGYFYSQRRKTRHVSSGSSK